MEKRHREKPGLGAFIFVLVGFPFDFLFPGVKVGAVGRAGKGKEKPFGLGGT